MSVPLFCGLELDKHGWRARQKNSFSLGVDHYRSRRQYSSLTLLRQEESSSPLHWRDHRTLETAPGWGRSFPVWLLHVGTPLGKVKGEGSMGSGMKRVDAMK